MQEFAPTKVISAKLIPELKGKLDGLTVCVPIPTDCLVDIVTAEEKEITVKEANAPPMTTANRYLGYTDAPSSPSISKAITAPILSMANQPRSLVKGRR